MLDTVILGMLYDSDLTGYDLKKHIENGVGVFYRASFGSIYPALKKLAEKGLIHSQEEFQGSRQKKRYRITPQGKELFLSWLSEPINLDDSTNTHLAKVYFFDHLPHEIAYRQLWEYEVNNVNYLRRLQGLEKELHSEGNMKNHYYKMSTLYYGICILQETIRWCSHIRGKKSLEALL